jgi:RNase H-like domain found in reverse transcriptase/Reverse transcriptase (RNA-dependent DNA polymerase)
MAMRRIMARLESYNYVVRTPLATIVSPAYPVKKPKVAADAPLEDQYRITVDLRAVNACTIPTKFPLPRLETFMELAAGKKYFGSLDLFGGYWQLPLDKESQRFFAITTDCGVWTPLRLIQGSRNAAGPFQAVVVEVLGDCVPTRCLVYIDDILILGDTEEQFVDNWIEVVSRLHKARFKISAKKTEFYAKEVKYCGRVFSADGVKFNPDFVKSVAEMPLPTTVAALRSYLASANWLRTSIPKFAAVVQPLQDLLTVGLAIAAKERRNTNLVMLSDVGWNERHAEVFGEINKAIAHSVTLAYPDDKKVICVFTDASETHWSGVVTQIQFSELAGPVLEQAHEPLGFVSGAFQGSQQRWPIVEKEAFAILETCLRLEHMLRRPGGFKLYTDHNNLKYIFSPDPSVFDGRKSAADRVERWSIILRGFTYEISHIPGEDNVLADLLTRWGATPVRVVKCRVVTRSRAAVAAASTAVTTPMVADTATRDVAMDGTVAPSTPSLTDHDSTTVPAAMAGPPVSSPGDALSTFKHDLMLEFDVDDAPTVSELETVQKHLSV